jgi:hypothetical protein
LYASLDANLFASQKFIFNLEENNNYNTNSNLYHCIQAYRGMEVKFHTLNSTLYRDGLLHIVSLCDGGKHFASGANPEDGGNTVLRNVVQSSPVERFNLPGDMIFIKTAVRVPDLSKPAFL